jgi:hypothetical protein
MARAGLSAKLTLEGGSGPDHEAQYPVIRGVSGFRRRRPGLGAWELWSVRKDKRETQEAPARMTASSPKSPGHPEG